MTRSSVAFGVSLALVAAMFVAVSLFVHPVADDFDLASARRESGVLDASRQQYLTWNGRYSSNVLALAIPLEGTSVTSYRAAIAGILVSTFVATFLLGRALVGGAFTRGETAIGALAFVVLFLCGMPALGEGMYWYVSAVTYHVAIVAAAVYVALIAIGLRSGRTAPIVAAAVLLFVVCGFNEVTSATVLVGHLIALATVWSDSGGRRWAIAALCAVAAIGAAAIVGSPGNAARLAEYPARHSLVASVVMTGLQTVRFVSQWSTSGPLLLASAIWTGYADRIGAMIPAPRARRYLAACIAGLLLVAPLAAFPAYWATGILGQHRTLNTAYFEFLVLWFAALTCWCAWRPDMVAAFAAVSRQMRVPLAALLLVAVGLTHNSYDAVSDFASGKLRAYDRAMEERYATLEGCRARHDAVCQLTPIEAPASLFSLDVSANEHDWVNVAYARYFGVPLVRVAPLSIPDVRH